MINVVVPMAGLGKRTKDYSNLPKPLIEVEGKRIFQLATKPINIKSNLIFIVLDEHLKYGIVKEVSRAHPDSRIIVQPKKMRGSVESVLLSESCIKPGPLLIIDCDISVKIDVAAEIKKILAFGVDGAILISKNNSTDYSYVKINNGRIIEIAEKRAISNNAISGMYFWKDSSDYFKYAKQLINSNVSINGEFYNSMVFEIAIKDGKDIAPIFTEEFYHLGTAESIVKYLNR